MTAGGVHQQLTEALDEMEQKIQDQPPCPWRAAAFWLGTPESDR